MKVCDDGDLEQLNMKVCDDGDLEQLNMKVCDDGDLEQFKLNLQLQHRFPAFWIMIL
jgi:hypothetical protein